jgi:hypothetical protein
MRDDKVCYPVAIIKRKFVLSRLRHYTVDSIYGYYHLVEVKGQKPSFLLNNSEGQIAQGSRKLHGSIEVEMENEQNRKFVLALFVLVLSD